MFKFKQYDFKRYNITLIIIVIILGLIGAFLQKQVQAEGENLLVKHLYGIIGGLCLALIVSLFDYHFVCKFFILMYLFNLALLVLVRTNGVVRNNAKRWIYIGFEFQPSELSKIILIIFISMLFNLLRSKINNILVILLSLVLIGIPVYLIKEQPNLSTSMVILFIFAMMIFAAGLSWKIILPILFIGIPIIAGLFWYVQQDYQVLLTDYQRGRVMSFLNPEENSAIMFQQDNSVLAIGSGQLYGKVLGEDEGIRNYKSIPISESDFIFSVAGEEFGFVGS
jgi:rod shape determining protein RodA